ncbi:MAG: hypothetical protein ACYDEI_00005, partial [Erysipelotrichaceae bacterium]
MCDFVSGIIREKDEEILIYDFKSHFETASFFGLKGEEYREFEWTGEDEDSLIVRVKNNSDIPLRPLNTSNKNEIFKNENWYRSIILSKFPKRIDLLKYYIPLSKCEDLDLSSITSADGLVLPEKINSYLDLRSLTSADGLVLPEKINSYLDLRSLTSADGLVLPKECGSLYLSSITSADGLVLPKKINSYLDLRSLTSADGLVLPKECGSLYLSSITSADGLVLPK